MTLILNNILWRNYAIYRRVTVAMFCLEQKGSQFLEKIGSSDDEIRDILQQFFPQQFQQPDDIIELKAGRDS